MREQLEVGGRHQALMAERVLLAPIDVLYPQGRAGLTCSGTRLSASGAAAAPSFFTFPVPNLQMSRTMKTNENHNRTIICQFSQFGARADTERSGLSKQCKRSEADHSAEQPQPLFHFQQIFRKTDSGCKNLKQLADSPSDESKLGSDFEQADNGPLKVHDRGNGQNAVSGSEAKFFLDSSGQRNYYDRKFSGDKSVGAVSAFFHLRTAAPADTVLSPFRFESSGDGPSIPYAHYFVRLKKAESRKRRQSELSIQMIDSGTRNTARYFRSSLCF